MGRIGYLWRERRYLAAKRREALLCWVVWHLPRSIVYWSAIRVGAHATTGPYSRTVVPELAFTDALKRWEDR